MSDRQWEAWGAVWREGLGDRPKPTARRREVRLAWLRGRIRAVAHPLPAHLALLLVCATSVRGGGASWMILGAVLAAVIVAGLVLTSRSPWAIDPRQVGDHVSHLRGVSLRWRLQAERLRPLWRSAAALSISSAMMTWWTVDGEATAAFLLPPGVERGAALALVAVLYAGWLFWRIRYAISEKEAVDVVTASLVDGIERDLAR